MSHDPAAGQIAAYLDWYFDRNPVHADALGVPGYSHQLGDFSATAFDSNTREATTWLARFEAEPDGIDRDLVVSALRGQLLMAGWPAWRRDPSVYLTPVFAGLLLPFLHKLHPEPELVDAAVSRLAELPGVLASCRTNLDPALSAPLLVRRALGQAAAGPAFLRHSLPAEVSDPELRARLVDAAGPAVRAFEETAGFLTEFAERATGDWRMGETLYSALLQQQELLGYGAAELHVGASRPGTPSMRRWASWHLGYPAAAPTGGPPWKPCRTTTRPRCRRCARSTRPRPRGPGPSSPTTNW